MRDDDDTDRAEAPTEGLPPDDSSTEAGEDDESEWRFTLEDIENREAEAETAAEAERRRREPIEPGSPSIENAAFVLLGVVFALFVLSRLVV